MLKSQMTPIQITANESALSKGQKTFNNQIRQIEKLRKQLAAWDTATIAYQEKYTRELVPLFAIAAELETRLVHALDRASTQKELTRAERSTLGELIVDLAAQLLGESDDAELKAIYNKYSRSDYDSEEAGQVQDVKDMLEDLFGIDMGDDAYRDSPEEFLQRAQARVREQVAQNRAEQQAHEERRAQRKKTAKQLEKEARAEADAKLISQSIRDIYRKLASALHPDRETDPQERARKTELMQRINQAYDKQNLLLLLELQLELEHIDRDVISRLDEERLRHYNVILKKQIDELKLEAMRVESQFCMQFGISPFVQVKPETVLRDLDVDIASVKQATREVEEDLHALESAKGVKAWLKQLRRRRSRGIDIDDCPF